MDTASELRINCENAGLVLLWPFLSAYFDLLGMLQDGQFKSPDARNRAVYLLHYLAYQHVEFEEHQMVLNKVLVGYPVKDSLLPIEPLSLKEKEHSESLMKGFIANWDKVKQSTPQAIRETFVQRRGLLNMTETEHKLVVEKFGVDALLMSLPWSIAVLKLSWMPVPLYINW